jgi:hypothetical protein
MRQNMSGSMPARTLKVCGAMVWRMPLSLRHFRERIAAVHNFAVQHFLNCIAAN